MVCAGRRPVMNDALQQRKRTTEYETDRHIAGNVPARTAYRLRSKQVQATRISHLREYGDDHTHLLAVGLVEYRARLSELIHTGRLEARLLIGREEFLFACAMMRIDQIHWIALGQELLLAAHSPGANRPR